MDLNSDAPGGARTVPPPPRRAPRGESASFGSEQTGGPLEQIRDDGTPIDVFILASVRMYEEGLAHVLSSDPRFRVVATASNAQDGVECIGQRARCPDVGLIDVGPPSGFANARVLQAYFPGMRLIALAASEREEDVISWAEAGVSGFITSDTALEAVKQAVVSVARTGALCPPHIAATLLRRVVSMAAERPASSVDAKLTRRERDILALIEDGLSNKQIAQDLQLSVATVKNHVHSILDKLGVKRRGEAATILRGHRSRTMTPS